MVRRRFAIGVVGSSDQKGANNAYILGTLLGDKNWVVITGGRNQGVMDQVNKGVKDSKLKAALTIGILPKWDSEVSPYVDIAVMTDLNNARNNIIGLSCDVLVACGIVGAGTASEVALALKNKRCKVLVVDADRVAQEFFQTLGEKIAFVASPRDAVEHCEKLSHALA